MHAGKVGCAGQAVALATSNDSGGRKSRIRRSKEERKSMVESFIQRYQTLNNGNFPSLNLTHKEVGGSFYTVREIVREIIQENRVLAPPKVSLEEHGLSGFLEQHPLGSISMEPLINLSVSDIGDVATHIEPDKIQFSSAENISISSGSYPIENISTSSAENSINGGYELADKDEGSDRMRESHHALDHYQDKSMEEVSNSPQSKSHKIEENTVNGFEVANGSPHSDKPLTMTADPYDDIDKGLGSQMLSNEQHPIKKDQTVDKAKEFGQRVSTEPTAMETLDREELEAQNVETSPAIKSHTNSDVVVETFPLRPVPGLINMAEESDNLQQATETFEDKGIEHDKKTFTRNSSSFVSEEGDKKLPHSTMELNGENSDEKVAVNLQGPSIEMAKHPSATKPSVLDAVGITELEPKVSLPDGAKANGSTETSISEDSTTVGGKSSDGDNSNVAKGNNPTLDRINLETWDGAAKKTTQPETNPLMAFVKAIISSFVKFWTE
ncbi:hypothetical protein C2S53_019124 [Perilla frutescens var. hirtella]|uniref:AT3G52170-like helix-turn-helix domain-containing protein n=1 Tax=Perilla frutescens var. hirtella TaxID=608512 RepID=A0AAD4PGK7_PERFH|nr:hypothetical protein C2S53_019124 [Perilla frutescens var. hirtella]